MTNSTKQIALFIPCMVDQIYPEMGIAMVDVLESLGYTCHYDPKQVCCGQPAYNAGQLAEARKVAKTLVNCFGDDDMPIVCPSGSCTAMVRNHYERLFADTSLAEKADAVAKRTYEFSEFLFREGAIDAIKGTYAGKAIFHCSCHALREIELDQQVPRSILNRIEGLELQKAEGPHQCCGFGGLFYVKFPSISDAMTEKRLDQLLANGAELIISNDPGCIMTLRRMLKKQERPVEAMHLTEFLAKAMKRKSSV
jgi:L-lactate dehydrogenase complex protein LldE